MQIENQFDVPAPPEVVWANLVDVPKVAPCFPRCRLDEVIDDRTWNGAVTVFLGPISYTFPGRLTMRERDDTGQRVVLQGTGREERGHGAANIQIVSWLRPAKRGTTSVHISVDLELEGRVAEYSRPMIEDVAARLVQIFAENFRSNLLAQQAAPEARRPWVAEKQIGGLRLAVWALWRALARLFHLGGKRAVETSKRES